MNNNNNQVQVQNRGPAGANRALEQQVADLAAQNRAMADAARERARNPRQDEIDDFNFDTEYNRAASKNAESLLLLPSSDEFRHLAFTFEYHDRFSAGVMLRYVARGAMGTYMATALGILLRWVGSSYPFKRTVALTALLNLLYAAIKIYSLIKKGVPYMAHRFAVSAPTAMLEDWNVRSEAVRKTPSKYPALLAQVVYSKFLFGVKLPYAGETFAVSRSLFYHSHSALNNDVTMSYDVLFGRNQRTINTLPVDIPYDNVENTANLYSDSLRLKMEWLRSVGERVVSPFPRSNANAPIT